MQRQWEKTAAAADDGSMEQHYLKEREPAAEGERAEEVGAGPLQTLEELGKDPTHWSFRKVLVATIRNNVTKVERNNLFFFYLRGRGISKVEIVGIVTRVTVTAKRVMYYVDDGTAPSMRCTRYLSAAANEGGHQNQVSARSFRTGDLVSAKGVLVLSETNDEAYGFNLHLSLLEAAADPNLEAFHWLACAHLFAAEY